MNLGPREDPLPVMEDNTVKHPLPDTINLHFTPRCNARCRFCFAEYSEIKSICSTQVLKEIITQIAEVPSDTPRRINFVGGESTTHADLPEMLAHAKNEGLSTSIVTNGLNLLLHGIEPYRNFVDLIGLSIDSVEPATILQTGRYNSKTGFVPTSQQWLSLADDIHSADIGLKINTVVTRLNLHEDMTPFIRRMTPKKWKLFQVTRVAGQNDTVFSHWAITPEEFEDYCKRHFKIASNDLQIVPESSDIMLNSYAIIGPNGCFVDNHEGRHSYSPPINETDILDAWHSVRFDHTAYVVRHASRPFSQEVANV